jgi:hypothetical protein
MLRTQLRQFLEKFLVHDRLGPCLASQLQRPGTLVLANTGQMADNRLANLSLSRPSTYVIACARLHSRVRLFCRNSMACRARSGIQQAMKNDTLITRPLTNRNFNCLPACASVPIAVIDQSYILSVTYAHVVSGTEPPSTCDIFTPPSNGSNRLHCITVPGYNEIDYYRLL